MMRPGRFGRSAAPRRGAVAVLMSVCLIALIGVMSFAMDVGILMSTLRETQTVADSAAHAAACSLWTNYSTNSGTDPKGTAKAAALALASDNGYTNDGTTSIITVNIPPKTGNFASKACYAEVIAVYNQPKLFSAIWGAGTMSVSSRSVARVLVTESPVIIALNSSASGALTFNGGFINASGSSIQIDSSNSSAALNTSGSGKITAQAIDIVGNYNIPSWASTSTFFSTTPATSQPSIADPLASLASPSTSGMPNGTPTPAGDGGAHSISAGLYTGGLHLTGGDTITMNPGTYYMKGGSFIVDNGVTVTGAGVTIYIDNGGGQVSFQGGGKITLSAPTTGTYAGVVIFQDRTSTQPISIANGSTISISGTVYAAKAQFQMAGGATNNQFGTQLVVDSLNMTNNATLNFTTSSTSSSTHKISIVE